jgi:hypothetical protein
MALQLEVLRLLSVLAFMPIHNAISVPTINPVFLALRLRAPHQNRDRLSVRNPVQFKFLTRQNHVDQALSGLTYM